MLRVVIQAMLEGESSSYDLEVPAEVPASELVGLVARAMGWSAPGCDFEVTVQPSGKPLIAAESLADAELWDGTSLLFRRVAQRARPVVQPPVIKTKSGRDHPIAQSIVELGRRRSNEPLSGDLVDLSDELDANTVSHRHARLALTEDHWILSPLASSRNPTRVNGQIVPENSEYYLMDGDFIQLGNVGFYFYLYDEANNKSI